MRRAAIVGVLILGLFGCTPGKPVSQAGTDEASETLELAGQVLIPRLASPAPGDVGPTIRLSPVPEETPYTPFAVHVAVSSDYATLNVEPPLGVPVTYRCTANATALVTMSNGYKNPDVTWESSDPGMAIVDSSGHVRGVGTRAGTVEIVAWSRDRQASGSLTLQVTSYGDAEFVVE